MKKRREILEAAGLGSAALMAAMAVTPGMAQAETLPAAPEVPPNIISALRSAASAMTIFMA